MTHQEQFLTYLAAVGVTYEQNPGGSGTTITVRDTSGTGYAEWRFDFAGALEWVKHYSG